MNYDYLIIPKIKIHNANALSSPFTIGFPAMTAWLGAVHAMQRQLNKKSIRVAFLGAGVVCHQFELQTYKGEDDFVHSIVGKINPLIPRRKRRKDEPWQKFQTPPFIEEARCHLEASLIIEVPSMTGAERESIIQNIQQLLHAKIKIAGGDILDFDTPYISDDFDNFKNKLMPGYVIVERRDLMIEAMEQGKDALDALLSFLTVNCKCEQNGKQKVTWLRQRRHKGWLVPIATGFHGISELGAVKNQRDKEKPHRFAESLVTLGEFKMPYRIDSVKQILWRYETNLENNLYLCKSAKYKGLF